MVSNTYQSGYDSMGEKREHWRVYGNEAEMINTDQTFDSRDTGFATNPDYVPTTDPRKLEEEESRS